MMRCDHSQNLFARAWDDELTVAEREPLEAHWSGCAVCRRAYDDYARTLELVQALPRPTVSADFAARVLSEARRREAETNVASRWGRSGWAFGLAPRPAMALAAAFAVALGVGSIALYAPRGGAPTATRVHVTEPTVAVAPPAAVSTPADESALTTEPATVAARMPDATSTIASAPARTERTPSAPTASFAAAEAAVVPDSLFDHTADVELVLDPVQLRRERGRGYTPVPTTVRGEAASITF